MTKSLTQRIRKRLRREYRLLKGRMTRRPFAHSYCDETLRRSLGNAIRAPAAIRDHLTDLYFFGVLAQPNLIVELGTRGGDSTRAFLAAAHTTDALVLSVDIDPCGELAIDDELAERWHFVQGDDVAFGRDGFTQWCAERGLRSKAQLIFIDSSHIYEHTKEEIQVWVEHLDEEGWLLFHDTNMGSVYHRLDNSIGLGWDNDRGVIRAIEDFLHRRYDEHTFFADVVDGFLVLHHPNSSGLTVLKRLPGKRA